MFLTALVFAASLKSEFQPLGPQDNIIRPATRANTTRYYYWPSPTSATLVVNKNVPKAILEEADATLVKMVRANLLPENLKDRFFGDRSFADDIAVVRYQALGSLSLQFTDYGPGEAILVKKDGFSSSLKAEDIEPFVIDLISTVAQIDKNDLQASKLDYRSNSANGAEWVSGVIDTQKVTGPMNWKSLIEFHTDGDTLLFFLHKNFGGQIGGAQKPHVGGFVRRFDAARKGASGN